MRVQAWVDGEPRNDNIADQIIMLLRGANAQTVIIEEEYLDRDFSAEYAAFYATLFNRYRRPTTRLHFFATALKPEPILELSIKLARASADNEYLGFVVLRSVPDSPIGRTVLLPLPRIPGFQAVQEVRSKYDVHLLGAKLTVEGVPFAQQDNRVSACAQASIWICGRHFHNHNGGPWKSTVAITKDASSPTDGDIARSLPAGSEGLSDDHIIRALAAMDRHPYSFEKPFSTHWLAPEAILTRYVRSGIPVIVHLDRWAPGQRIGHTIVVTGCVFDHRTKPRRRPYADWSIFVPYFIVQDDQLGPNLLMPVEQGRSQLGQTPYNLRSHASRITVPLPEKVFTKAEVIERAAWQYLEGHFNEWPERRTQHESTITSSLSLADQVANAARRKQVVARTSLTYGAKYKSNILLTGASNALKQSAIEAQLPRMVWVTEFGAVDDLQKDSPDDRRIFAHGVFDATSAGPTPPPPLLFHVPGFVWTRSPSGARDPEDIEDIETLIDGDNMYLPGQRH